jgi:dTDP-glucose 4,6-dehydratase
MARSAYSMKILLTGASGFAGAHMLRELLKSNYTEISCPVTYNHGGNINRIPALLSNNYNSSFNLQKIDLACRESVIKLMEFEFDTIINFASESHVDRSISDPLNFFHNNLDLMINLLEISRIKKIKHFVHISTDEVYGSLPFGSGNREWQYPHRPSNPYSASKSSQEAIAMSYSKTFKIPITIVNSTNLIGEAQNQEKFLPKIMASIVGKKIVYVDTSETNKIGSRKYVYAGDLSNAIIKILENLNSEENPLRKYHVSGSEEFSNLEIVNIVGEILGIEPKIEIRTSPRPGYDLRYELNSDILRRSGWQESDTVKNHIKKIVNWTLSNPDWLTIDYGQRQQS